jgi:hypothetical protein
MMAKVPGFKLRDADAYTDIWDDAGLVTINPFLAFAINEPNRKFGPHSEHTRTYEIEFPELNELVKLTLVVDASWPGNCREPYDIINAEEEVTFLDFEKNDILCQVKAWNDDVKSVHLVGLDCLGYVSQMEMAPMPDDWWAANDLYWHEGGSDEGEYQIAIVAKTVGSAMYLVDYQVIKLTGNPNPVGWARTFGGTNNDLPNAVTTDNLGNVYIGGYFRETVDFDTGPDTYEVEAQGLGDAFLCKFNPTGEFQWTNTLGGDSINSGDCVGDIAIDNSNGVYVTGWFNGTSVDFDPGPGEDLHDSNGGIDAFLIKFDANGTFVWGHNWGGNGSDYGYGVALDDDGNAYVVGYFYGTVDFDPGDGVEEHTSDSPTDMYLSSFDAEGNFRWVRIWGCSGGDAFEMVRDLVTDNIGHVYLVGEYGGVTDFDPGPEVDEHEHFGHGDVFLSCFNISGDYLWARTWGGDGWECCYALTLDDVGNIYITGSFDSTADFDPGPSGKLVMPFGHRDTYVSKFNADGDFQWVRTWGSWDGSTAYCAGVGVATDGGGRLYVTGRFDNMVNFANPGGTDVHTSTGKMDIYLVCLDLNSNYKWTRTWGSSDNDEGWDVTVGSDANVLIAGTFWWDVDFFPGPGADIHSSNGEEDVFLMKLTPDGLW